MRPHIKFARRRLLRIATEVRKVIDEFEPEGCAIETLFLGVNQKTVMPVAEARGAVLVEAARANLAVYEYTPLQIKIAVTGYGRSEKTQVTEMVKKLILVPEKTSLLPKKAVLPLLRENKSTRLDDEYDAIAVGLTCLASERQKKG